MSYPVQVATTRDPLVFLMVLSSDHITGATGLSPTVTLCKVGGAFAAPAGAVTEIANGYYQVAGNATDNNTLGPLLLHATAATADPTDKEFWVVAQNLTTATIALVTTTTNLTNAPTAGDLTAAMKASVTAAVPTAGAIATGVWQDTTAGDFTVANSIGKALFFTGVAGGATVTLVAGTTFQKFRGDGWLLALGGQNIEGSSFYGAESVTGTSTGNVFPPIFDRCVIGDATLPPCVIGFSLLAGTLSVLAGTYMIEDCNSHTPTIGALVTLDMGAAVGVTKVNIRKYSGAITIKNCQAGDLVTFEGVGAVTIDATCTGGSIVIRGVVSLTDNVVGGFGSVGTLTQEARLSQNAISDAYLDRNMASGVDSGSPAVRTPRQALRALRNKVDASTATATVFKEDDTTPSWTTALTTNAGAVPVIISDPA